MAAVIYLRSKNVLGGKGVLPVQTQAETRCLDDAEGGGATFFLSFPSCTWERTLEPKLAWARYWELLAYLPLSPNGGEGQGEGEVF